MTSYGKNIEIRIFGGSHDEEIGVTVEGLPEGITIDVENLQKFMARRAPGQNKLTTSRKEPDIPVITSGVDENNTTNGQTFRAVIRNTNQRSADYKNLHTIPRPSHADYTAMIKSYGKADLRGGGHFSGRLTAPMCIIGGILKAELENLGIHIGAHIYSVYDCHDTAFDPVAVSNADFDAVLSHEFPVIDVEAGEKMQKIIDEARLDKDSVGGVIECAVIGLPIGLGEHIFAGMESRIASIVFSVPAVKGIEFGAGFSSTLKRGSQNNDPFYADDEAIATKDKKKIKTKSNNCGGILGGMTNGMPLIFRTAIKPTPSIGLKQESVDLDTMENVKFTIQGRHDPFIGARAVPVIEAAAAIAVFDAMLDYEEEIEA